MFSCQYCELFKVWFSPSKIILCYLLDSKQFKSDENAFYFILKALFVFKICKFLSRLFWSCRKNGLIRNISWTLKFMTSQLGLQTFAIHILQNISKSKDNRIMKFGQLIEQNKINIFLQKLCGKWGRETSSRPLIFSISLKWGESKRSAA